MKVLGLVLKSEKSAMAFFQFKTLWFKDFTIFFNILILILTVVPVVSLCFD